MSRLDKAEERAAAAEAEATRLRGSQADEESDYEDSDNSDSLSDESKE